MLQNQLITILYIFLIVLIALTAEHSKGESPIHPALIIEETFSLTSSFFCKMSCPIIQNTTSTLIMFLMYIHLMCFFFHILYVILLCFVSYFFLQLASSHGFHRSTLYYLHKISKDSVFQKEAVIASTYMLKEMDLVLVYPYVACILAIAY